MPALDPNAQIRPDEIIDDPELFPEQLPQGVSKSGDFYAIKKQLADGRIAIEWYKRGTGGGGADPVLARSQGYAKTVADDYAKQQQQQGTQSQRTIQRAGHTWQWNPQTNGYDVDLGATDAQSKGPPGGKPYLDEEGPNGRRLGWNPETQQYDRDLGASGAARPQTTTGEDRKPVEGHPGVFQVTRAVKDAQDNTRSETSYVDASGAPVAGPAAPVQPVSGPPNQKWIISRDPATQEPRYDKNPNYQPPSQIQQDPATGRWIQVTEDKDGNPVVRPVTAETIIKPNEIPVLQARYGQIGQGLGTLLADLNGRVSRNEMTSQERDAAFKAAHQQAEVQVNEINSILTNSKAVWENQLQERGQTFGEAASRRSFAGNVLTNAVSTGRGIAESAGPGHGAAIASGVAALLDIGQRYAAGMGGFPSMQAPAIPPALQQAASVGLPGFGPGASMPPGAGPTGPAGGGPPPTAGSSAVGPVGQGITATTAAAVDPTRANVDAANRAVGAASTSAFGALGVGPGAPQRPLLPPPPPVPGQSPVAPPLGLAPPSAGATGVPLPYTGQDPGITPMGGLGEDRGIERRPVPGAPGVPPYGQRLPEQPGPLQMDPMRQGLGAASPLGTLGSMFGAGPSPLGVPLAIGGGGLFDPHTEGQSMLGASTAGGYGGQGVADPAWEEAVRRAMGMLG